MQINLPASKDALTKEHSAKINPIIIGVDGSGFAGTTATYSTMKESLCKEWYNDALRAEFVFKSEGLKNKQ